VFALHDGLSEKRDPTHLPSPTCEGKDGPSAAAEFRWPYNHGAGRCLGASRPAGLERLGGKHIICHVNDICLMSDLVALEIRRFSDFPQRDGVCAEKRDGNAKMLPGPTE